jgi:predicted transcriptional regulator of viral defense system
MYINRNTDYLKRLISGGKRIYRIEEIGLLWQMTNGQTLRVTVSRYQKRGWLHRLSRGVYSIIEPEKLNPFEIGCAVAGSLSYISLQTVLYIQGWINQPSRQVTLIGMKTMRFTVGVTDYYCRAIHPRFLVQRAGIEAGDGYDIATAYRALADMDYLSNKLYVDNRLLIDKKMFTKMKKEVGYEAA